MGRATDLPASQRGAFLLFLRGQLRPPAVRCPGIGDRRSPTSTRPCDGTAGASAAPRHAHRERSSRRVHCPGVVSRFDAGFRLVVRDRHPGADRAGWLSDEPATRGRIRANPTNIGAPRWDPGESSSALPHPEHPAARFEGHCGRVEGRTDRP